MKTSEEIKSMVRETYAGIAQAGPQPSGQSCCGTQKGNVWFNEDYSKLEGYVADADLGLGCGIPVEFSKIKNGDVVIDLGAGAGNDAFIARRQTGETGKVIGIDMTSEMIDRARENNDKLGYNNVEFRLGEIEKLPVSANQADVIISNCVLNLVPDKQAAFLEIFRTLKPGGHFCVSDIVLSGPIPEKLRSVASMYAGCVSGAVQKEEYLNQIKSAGFDNISINKERTIHIPQEVLAEHLTKEEMETLASAKLEVLSITVSGEKPSLKFLQTEKAAAKEACCAPGCCA